MDRRNVVGFILLGVLLIGFFVMQSRFANEERIAQAKQQQIEDSINRVKKHYEDSVALANQKLDTSNVGATISEPVMDPALGGIAAITDSNQIANALKIYGNLWYAYKGEEKTYSIENEFLKLTFTNKGGRILEAELKKYKHYEGGALNLIKGNENKFNYSFWAADDKLIKTEDLYFEAVPSSDGKSIVFKIDAGNGRVVEQVYAFNETNYLVDYNLKMTGFDRFIPANRRNIQLVWQNDMQEQEKNISYERQYSKMYFSYSNGDIDYKNTNGEIKFNSKVKWLSCQQQFFNTTLIAMNEFESGGFMSVFAEDTSRYVKRCNAEINIPFNNSASFDFPMQWYLAPNEYKPLAALDLGIETIVPTGSGFIGWLNEKIILPLFHWLSGFSANYGLIILMLTVIIKLALTPLTYRSYLSMAKMRVLNPEMAEIREKFKDDQARLGQEQLKLYRKAGVSPLGGCIPTLLSMPILIAMFRLFPGSIELRQQSFLWANDLSTYDDLIHWGAKIPFIGQHLSIFCVLMTISSIMYIRMNMQNTSQLAGPMKTIQYITPVFFLFFLNSSPAGLTYYYFVSNITTFGQQWLIRRFFINDDEIHRKIQENKAKPEKAKSGFSKRLEEAMKQSQAIREAKEKQQQGRKKK